MATLNYKTTHQNRHCTYNILKIHLQSLEETRNRIILLICDTPTYVNTLRQKYDLPITDAYTKYTQELSEKMQSINPELLTTPAMTQNRWKECMQTDRHIVTRHAAHGFHHLICTRNTFHEADLQCTCKICGQNATQYHILNCAQRVHPLRHYANCDIWNNYWNINLVNIILVHMVRNKCKIRRKN